MPWLSVLENVEFGLRMRGMAKAERRAIAGQTAPRAARKVCRLPDLPDLRGHAAARRRGAGAGEVTSSDADGRTAGCARRADPRAYRDLIVNLWWQTKMFFFITHSVEEALFMATELIVMTPSPGRIAHRFQPGFLKQFIDCQDSRAHQVVASVHRHAQKVLALIHRVTGADDGQ